MEILIIVIIGAVVLGVTLSKKTSVSVVAPTVAAPAPIVARASAPAPAPPPVSVAPAPQSLAVTLQTIENQIQALAPKPVDPLAAKLAPPPAPTISSLFASIKPAMTPAEALNEAKLHDYNYNPRDFNNSSFLNDVYGQIIAMHTVAWKPPNGPYRWAGAFQPGPNLQLIGQGSQLALSATGDVLKSVGSTGVKAIPFIGTIVSGIIDLFGIISAHHKAAVQRDATAFNIGLSTVENYLKIIHDAVLSGQSTPQEGIQALNSMYQDFLTYTAPARNNSPYCNSVCEAKVGLNALVIYWEAYFNQIIAARG